MASQSTSSGITAFVPSNRDPRYLRPIYALPDYSNESIILEDTDTLTKLTFSCTLCNKIFNSNKGLKLHTTRIHLKTSEMNDPAPTNVNMDTIPLQSSPLEKAYGCPFSTLIDEDNLWYKRWERICSLRGKQYCLPNGNVSIHFINILAKEIELLSKNEFPSERLLVYISVMLQRDKLIKRSKDIRVLLKQRLTLWEADEVDILINEAISSDKKLCRPNSSKKVISESEIIKMFNRFMLRGKIREAMNCLNENGQTTILHPKVIESRSGKTVFEILQEKHPDPTRPDKNMFSLPQEMNELPYLQQITITNEVVEKVSRKLHGGGGPGGSNSEQWSEFLLRYGKASYILRDAVAALANELCNKQVEWKQIHALMSCRLIALDKCPGVRPIGIGECLRRILSKCVIEVTRNEVTEACQADQLCSGLSHGIEGAAHAMNALFDSKCHSNSNWGLLLVDAKNAFNMANRQMALWQARCYWPRAARFIYNTYRGNSELIVRDIKSKLYSKEGVIQGDPLSMPLYALTTLPLIKSLAAEKNVTQCWYADDSSAQGKFEDLLQWWTKLTTMGPCYGYHPEGSKSCLVVSEEDKIHAEQVFYGTDIQIVTGKRFLGSYIGSEIDKKDFIMKKIDEWNMSLVKLTTVARYEPQSAYAAFVKSMQFHWTFLQRVLDVGDEFTRLYDIIKTQFLPTLFGTSISNEEASLFTLPVRKGGLAIMDPSESSKCTFDTSRQCCSTLVTSIIHKEEFNLQRHIEIVDETKKLYRLNKNKNDEEKLQRVLSSLPTEKKRTVERSILKITKTSSSNWLTVVPTKRDQYDLSPNEFRDALAIRYHKQPINMPTRCDGCGKNGFDLDHALCCKTGGLITRRHNEIRDLLGEMCMKSWGNVVKEPMISEEEPCLRGDLAVRGVWEAQREALFDIRVVDTDAPSYVSRPVMAILINAEEEKKKKYLYSCEQSHATFTPLVLSVDGVFAPQMNSFFKVLTDRLAEKTFMEYSKVKSWTRTRLSFGIIRAASMCVRGTRRKFKTGESLLGFQ